MNPIPTTSSEAEGIFLNSKGLFVLAGLGILARIAISLISVGTNDATTWQNFAEEINAHGLLNLYVSNRLFNHPPLVAMLIAWLDGLAIYLELPFPFLLRLPGILAEAGSAVLLYLIWNQRHPKLAAWIVCLFAWNPVSVLISGYHGNTDSIMAFFGLLACYLAMQPGRAFLSGVALAAAVNVKLIPILLLPGLVLSQKSFGQKFKFLFAFGLGCLPLLICFIFLPEQFSRNVFHYNSELDYWGIQLPLLLMREYVPALSLWSGDLIEFYRSIGRYVILVGIGVLLWILHRRQNENIYKTAALSYAAFAILAPGFGGQYFVIFPPLLFAFAPLWGVIVSLAAGMLQLSSYLCFLISWTPIHSVHTGMAPWVVRPFALITWVALIALVCVSLNRRART